MTNPPCATPPASCSGRRSSPRRSSGTRTYFPSRSSARTERDHGSPSSNDVQSSYSPLATRMNSRPVATIFGSTYSEVGQPIFTTRSNVPYDEYDDAPSSEKISRSAGAISGTAICGTREGIGFPSPPFFFSVRDPSSALTPAPLRIGSSTKEISAPGASGLGRCACEPTELTCHRHGLGTGTGTVSLGRMGTTFPCGAGWGLYG